MNNLLDLINTWSEKFTLRVLRLFGASPETLTRLAKAFKDKDESFINAERQLKNKVPILKIIFWFGLFILGAFVWDRFLSRPWKRLVGRQRY
jgi:hypothetical protein